jgi:uncharacterized membrane-anchored protein YitT (DUF2179 family)
MDFLRKKSKLTDFILITVGSALMALAIKCIYDPIGMVTGGFSGLAIIIKNITVSSKLPEGIPLSITSFVLNVPVFLIAWRVKGKSFVAKSFIAMTILSLWLAIWPAWDLTQGDYVIASIFGGGISGIGMGLILMGRSTTGGTDMLAAIIQETILPQYSIVKIMQIIDAAIVLLGLYLFGLKSAMYAIIAIIIVTRVSDIILEGMQISRAVYILSDKKDEIAECIMRDLDRGVTGLKAKGMYTNDEKCMLFCVVSVKEIASLKDLVMDVDPAAFLIISDAREVWGEGFQSYKSKM